MFLLLRWEGLQMDKRKLIYSILKEIEQGNAPKFSDYGITKDEFGDTLEMMQSGNLITGATITRAGIGNKVVFCITNYSKLTMDGLKYLEENSAWTKTYRGIKEIRDWLKP